MSVTDRNNSGDTHGESSFVSSIDPLLGEETKNGGSGIQPANNGHTASSFSFKTPKGVNIEVRTLQDILDQVPAVRQWTVDGILPESGLAIVGGRHKRGKSTLVIHL